MSISQSIEKAITRVHDQQSFFQQLLSDTLGWPISDAGQIEDIAYGWTEQELNAAGLERELVDGAVWQIQPAAQNQPWGIFVLQFRHEDSLSARRGMAGVVRKVLRGLVSTRRKDPKLPSWKREHLLFICTYNWTDFRFAYFRSTPQDARAARLITFGWAPGTPNRTLCEFNLPALVWPEDASDSARWLRSWVRAFDKEPLTRDFFKRFDNALDAIKADLEEYQGLSSAEAYTRSQLLLERLIFLYFLQNRGWLNQDRRYLAAPLQQYISDPDAFTYYTGFLDRVFWTLSTAPDSAGRLPGLPFLNGGLFDDDEFRPGARRMLPPLKVRNCTMQHVFAELLEAFNFTVTEDTPLNQEVAVDPEMLGKVFESIVLHAEEADPDAVAPDKRKATGSYYTPRIVVHFICQEALYQYLLNHLPGDGWAPKLKTLLSVDPSDGVDEEARALLRNSINPQQAAQVLDLIAPLKCCDPAVGSGAFPVGLMHELVNLRRLLETAANGYRDPVVSEGSQRWLHDAKEQIVENCLFGVDIQQQAIEICRLRLWLSLVVDYDLGLDPFTADKGRFARAIDRISQLPNLEMNFRRGDSLHDHICGVPVVILPDRASRHAAEFAAIAKLGTELHKAKRADRKKELRLGILEKRLDLSRKILDEELRMIRQRDSALDSLFGDKESDAEKRKRNRREIDQLEKALATVEKDRERLDKLSRREFDSQFYPRLRKLEGADFDSPFNFSWSIDFPGVFGAKNGGFDIIVGNPPFVTARNPVKRELWRERWPLVSFKEYQLVAPFFQCAVGLLKPAAQLGLIVSNGFAKRDFGKPLVEKLLAQLDVKKLVDCSGLMFPGHGTPTCLIFVSNQKAIESKAVRTVMTLPGGGDLRTPPEESRLWAAISGNHDAPRPIGADAALQRDGFAKCYEDSQIVVGECDRKRMFQHPCRWLFVEWPPFEMLSRAHSRHLRQLLLKDIGRILATSANDIFIVPSHVVRQAALEVQAVVGITQGDDIRNWTPKEPELLLRPYDQSWQLRDIEDLPNVKRWL